MQAQSGRYDAMLAELPTKIQEAKDKFEEAKDADLTALSAAEIQDYKDKLATMSGKFTEMQNALQKLQDMNDDAQDLVQRFSDIADDADGLSSVLSDVSDAYDRYGDAEDILNRIDAVDVSQYEGLYDSIKDDFEQAHNEMASAAAGLSDLKDSLESTRDELITLAADCEWQADYAEVLAEEIKEAFDNIPFPN